MEQDDIELPPVQPETEIPMTIDNEISPEVIQP